MTKWSYSRVDTFKRCQFLYFLRYIKKLKTLPNTDANSPLILGSTIHLAIEKGVDEARKFYFSQFPIISDEQINEFMKIELLYPKIKAVLPKGQCEVKLDDYEFVGFIDRLVQTSDTTFDIYDYKYSNNIESYMESGQLHLYKYYFEILFPDYKIENLYYVFIPKVAIRQKKTETLFDFRKRLCEELDNKEIMIERVEYNHDKVREFHEMTREIVMARTYEKNQTRLCDWCEFKAFCQSDGPIDWNIL